MPIPKPMADESHDGYMERCMSDAIMLDEYPDEKQRAAICESQWAKKASNQDGIEKRSFDFNLELRGESKEPKIVGHAAVFDEYTEIGGFFGGFKERIIRGAFTDSINSDDVRALFNHDPNFVLGRNRSGTLKMHEDEVGLAIEVDPPKTQFASDLMHLIERGDISQMSFAFQVLKDTWEIDKEGKEPDKRDILKVKLYDISPVTFPAYTGTDVALASRSRAIFHNNKGAHPDILRKKLNLKTKEVS